MKTGSFEENLVTKGALETDETVKIAEVRRPEEQKRIGEGVSEGNVYGGIEVVVKSSVNPQRTRKLNMAEKVMESPMLLTTPINPERIISNHARLRKLGFPVIPTIRLVDTPKDEDARLVMTDLTDGGKKSVYTSSFEPDYQEYPSFEISNPQEISNTLYNLYLMCNEKGVRLNHHDALFLVVDNETKEANIIMGDISRVSFPDISNQKEAEWNESLNYGSFQTFFRHMNLCMKKNELDFRQIKEDLHGKTKTKI